jgi:hypothetical protein
MSKEFAKGIYANKPHEKSYAKAKLTIDRKPAIEWLQSLNEEKINLEVKEGQSGKWYVAVDTWKPSSPAPEI